MRASWLWLSLCFSACVPRGPAIVVPMVQHGGAEASDLATLQRDFYGAGLSLEEAATRADAVLRQHPTSGAAHEIAGIVARQRGDTAAGFEHFLHALADLDADVPELYLGQLTARSATELDALADVLVQVREKHARPDVRALATHALANVRREQGRLDEARALVAELHPLATWQLLGALDNDQGKGFFTELAADQQPSIAIKNDARIPGPLVPLRWRMVEHLTSLGEIPLEDLTWPRSFGLAWLATWVHADAAQTVQLRLSTTSAVRAFVNDGEVFSDEHVGGTAFDNAVVTVSLRAGWNQLVVQSAHRRGPWNLVARFTKTDGSPLALRSSATPHPYTRAEGKPAEAKDATITGPEGRVQLMTALRRLREGRSRAALAELQPFVDAQPDNELALFYGAQTALENEELGRVIDLLDRGVDRFHGPAFLLERARYYEQKQLWEKAQSDLLSAITLIPPHTGITRAERDLADLFERRGWQVDRCQLLDKMSSRAPSDVWALRERAECLDALGFQARADAMYRRATKTVPGDFAAWEGWLRLAERRADLGLARKLAHKLVRLDETDPQLRVQLGDVERRRGDASLAHARYEEATHLAPEQPTAWKRLGELAYEASDKATALTAWKRARELEPDDSALAQHVEYLEPLRLGFIDKLVPGESELARALGRTVKPFPNAQEIVLLDHDITEVNADGSARRVVTEIDQAVDDKGRDAMTVQHVPTHGAVKMLRAYALGEHGERQEASSIRNGEVRFRNLQVGMKTVLQYIHYAPPPPILPGAFTSTFFFQAPGRQDEDSTWILVLPKDRTLHVQLTGDGPTEKRTVDGDRQLRTFHAEHMRPIAAEPFMAPLADLVARAEVSTVASWDEYVRWERGLLTDAFRTNRALDALTDKLAKDGKTPREKLDRLFHYVAQEIRYQQDYEDTIAGVRPHAAPSVVERGYGDCKDKAVLLTQMAKRIGVQLSFAILRTTSMGQVAKDVPDQQFNHAIVYVPKQEGFAQPLFLDPTSDGLDVGNLRPDDQGALSLVMEPQTGAWQFVPIPYESGEQSYIRHKIRIDVKSESDVTASDELTLRGGTAMMLRHALRNEGQAQQVMAAVASSLFPGATVRDSKSGGTEDTWHPLALTLDLDDSQAVKPEEDHVRLALPGRFALAGAVALRTRETPMHFGAPESYAYDIEARLPDGYEVTHTPKDFTIENDCFVVSRKAHATPRDVTLRVDLARRCADLPVAGYAEFRSAVQKAVRSLDDDLLFAKVARPLKDRTKKR